MRWTIRNRLRCSNLVSSPNQSIMARKLFVESVASSDEHGISIFIRDERHMTCYEVQYLPANLESKPLLSAYNESQDILNEASSDSIERVIDLLKPFQLMPHSGHEDDCRPPPEMPRLFDYIYPAYILIQATAALHNDSIVAIPRGAKQHPSPGYCLSTEQISRLQSMRRFTSKDVILSYNRCNPTIVTVGDVKCYFKQGSQRLQRIENDKPWIYQQVTSAINDHKLTSNVCRPFGVVIDNSEDENVPRMIGVLFEYITHKGTLDGVAQDCKDQRQLSDWVDDLKTIVDNMHEAGLVWGDAKPANVLVDNEDKLWVIDMDGGYTEPWVDADRKESKEGDLQGLDRMQDWITALSEELERSGG